MCVFLGRAMKIFFGPSLGGGDRPPRPSRGSATGRQYEVTPFPSISVLDAIRCGAVHPSVRLLSRVSLETLRGSLGFDIALFSLICGCFSSSVAIVLYTELPFPVYDAQ